MSDTTLSILVVQDPRSAAVCQQIPVLEVVQGAWETAATAGAHEQFSALLLDLEHSQHLAAIRMANPPLPIILVGDSEDEDQLLESCGQGADDYLLRDEMTPELVCRVLRHVRRCRILEEALESRRRLAIPGTLDHGISPDMAQRIRNSAASIEQSCESLLRQDPDPQAMHLLHLMALESSELGLLSEDLLDTAHLASGQLKLWRRATPLERLAQRVLLLAQSPCLRRDIVIESRVSPGRPGSEAAYCDARRTGRAIWRLLEQILEWLPRTQRIVLESGAGGPDRVRLGIGLEGMTLTPQQCDRLACNAARRASAGAELEMHVAHQLLEHQLIDVSTETKRQGGAEQTTIWIDIPTLAAAHLARRRVDQLISDQQPIVSVTRLSLDGTAEIGLVDPFLQQTLPSSDWAIPLPPTSPKSAASWLLLSPGSIERAAETLRQLLATWAILRKTESRLLPELQWDPPRAFQLPEERLEFDKQLRALTCVDRQVVLLDAETGSQDTPLSRRLQEAGYRVVPIMGGATLPTRFDGVPEAIVIDTRQGRGRATLEQLRASGAADRVPIIMLAEGAKEQHRALAAGTRFVMPENDEQTPDLVLDALAEAAAY